MNFGFLTVLAFVEEWIIIIYILLNVSSSLLSSWSVTVTVHKTWIILRVSLVAKVTVSVPNLLEPQSLFQSCWGHNHYSRLARVTVTSRGDCDRGGVGGRGGDEGMVAGRRCGRWRPPWRWRPLRKWEDGGRGQGPHPPQTVLNFCSKFMPFLSLNFLFKKPNLGTCLSQS